MPFAAFATPSIRRHLRPAAVLPALLLAAALLLPAPAAVAQGAASPHWAAGFRLGGFEMTNSSDSWDAVYGDVMPLVGGQVEWNLTRWRFAASLDYGTVDGERVLPTAGGNVIGTGVDQELTLIPLHLTAAWRINPAAAWEWSLGAGPSLLDWTEDGPAGSTGSTDLGGSVVLGLRWQRGVARGAAWDFGGELRWSTFPGAFDDTGGLANFFDEDDPGGLALSLLAVRRF